MNSTDPEIVTVDKRELEGLRAEVARLDEIVTACELGMPDLLQRAVGAEKEAAALKKQVAEMDAAAVQCIKLLRASCGMIAEWKEPAPAAQSVPVPVAVDRETQGRPCVYCRKHEARICKECFGEAIAPAKVPEEVAAAIDNIVAEWCDNPSAAQDELARAILDWLSHYGRELVTGASASASGAQPVPDAKERD